MPNCFHIIFNILYSEFLIFMIDLRECFLASINIQRILNFIAVIVFVGYDRPEIKSRCVLNVTIYICVLFSKLFYFYFYHIKNHQAFSFSKNLLHCTPHTAGEGKQYATNFLQILLSAIFSALTCGVQSRAVPRHQSE